MTDAENCYNQAKTIKEKDSKEAGNPRSAMNISVLSAVSLLFSLTACEKSNVNLGTSDQLSFDHQIPFSKPTRQK